MSNFLYHNKYHRTIHHTLPTPGIPDSATDPIASQSDPFLGPFYNYIDTVLLDEIPLSVKYLITYNEDAVTTFEGLSVSTLDSIFLVLTASAFSHSYNWYSAHTNISLLSTGYTLYPFLTGVTVYLSGSWDLGYNFYTTYKQVSTKYESVFTTVSSNSARWPFLETTLRQNRVQQNTRAKNFKLVNITTPNTNIYWDLSSQQVAYFSLTSSSTLKNIINTQNKKRGGEYFLIVQQDGYGGRTLTFEDDYKIMTTETAPILSLYLVNFPTKNIWTSSYYGSGYWVAVAYNDYRAARSDDNGSSWYGIPLPGIQNWRSVVYGMSAWITVCDSSLSAARSIDGLNWEYVRLPAKRPWMYVGYGNNTFIAVASASNKGARSVDGGNTWSEINLPITADWASVKYANDTWIAVAGGGLEGQNPTNIGATSLDDGQTWDAFTLPSSRLWSDVAYGEDYWVAVAKNSNVVALSSRLEGYELWFDYTIENAPVSGFSSITHGNDTFVAATLDPYKAIMHSADGKIWYSNNTTTPKAIFNVNYGGTSLGGSFYALGADPYPSLLIPGVPGVSSNYTPSYTNYRLIANDGPSMSTTTGVLTTALGVTVIRFICDGLNLYGIPSNYFVSRGPVWTYFAGPGITLNPNPTDLFIGEYLIPSPGITSDGAVVVDEGYSAGNGFLILSGIPIP